MRLRIATVADAAAVTAMEQRVFGADAWSGPSVLEELTGAGRAAMIAEGDDGAVAGYAVVLAGDVLDLQRIAVEPAWRRTGVGRRLLAAAVGAARDRAPSARRVLLEVRSDDEGARAFYEAAGFGELHRRARYYRDGADAVVMAAPPDRVTNREEAT